MSEELNITNEWDKVFPLSEKAHSCYMGKDAYNDMIKNSNYKDNKELVIIPGVTHTDLYDQKDKIPFDKIEKFLKDNLK